MLDWFLTHVRSTRHGGDALRVFLWWGFGVRAVLLTSMLTLLVVRGNFLAQWLWSLDILLIPTAEIEKLTLASYALLAGFLIVGAGARWTIIDRLNSAEAESAGDAPASSSSQASSTQASSAQDGSPSAGASSAGEMLPEATPAEATPTEETPAAPASSAPASSEPAPSDPPRTRQAPGTDPAAASRK